MIYYFAVTVDTASVEADNEEEAMNEIKKVIAQGVDFEIYDTEEESTE